MRTLQVAAACIVALGMTAFGAKGAGAQETAIASPFHAGQWGIEGYAAGPAGGVMRFFTPRTALVFTLSGEHLRTSAKDNGFGGSSNEVSAVDATLGLRRHSMLAPHLAAILGVGAIGGTVQQRREAPFPASTLTNHSVYIGGYLDFGAQYMLSDHFAAGLAYRLTGEHIGNGLSDQRGTDFRAASLPLRVTLYF